MTGNPFHCDCRLRPLQYWIEEQLDKSPWNTIRCTTPRSLEGRVLSELSAEALVCREQSLRLSTEYRFVAEIDVHPVKINEEDQSVANVRWAVKSREDIGDFQVALFSLPNDTAIFDVDVPYYKRDYTLQNLQAGHNYVVCVLAKDSLGNLRKSHNSQCQRFATSFRFRLIITQNLEIIALLISILHSMLYS